MKDFYYILGTDSNCTAAEIKEAYRKLSKKFHPDLNQGDKYFENRFREITEAYEILNDPAKRFQYDNSLKKSKSKDNSGQNAGRYHTGAPNPATKPKTRRSGSAFLITLILVGLIFGIYLVESFISTKKATLKKDIPVKTVVVKIHKHHKQKHSLKVKSSGDSAKQQATITPVKVARPIPVIKVKPLPAVNKNIDNSTRSYLYVTYVKANTTHIINMRQSDSFDSEIIERIPDNSLVYVLQRGDLYYRVSYNNHIGYVPRWSLQER